MFPNGNTVPSCSNFSIYCSVFDCLIVVKMPEGSSGVVQEGTEKNQLRKRD